MLGGGGVNGGSGVVHVLGGGVNGGSGVVHVLGGGGGGGVNGGSGVVHVLRFYEWVGLCDNWHVNDLSGYDFM